MAGHRPSRPTGLRLISGDDAGAHAVGDHRPVILHAVGTPRERLLLSPLVAELRRLDVARQVVVAVGDDDAALAGVPDLALPDRRLELAEHTPAHRLAALMAAFEHAIDDAAPELVVVAGGGDAGLAAALAAAKRGIAVAHVEAGVRHPDPRRADLHRVLDDRLADTLLAPTAAEAANLVDEGIPDTRVHVVGQTDVDLLRRLAPRARARRAWAAHDLPEHGYVLVELDPERLAARPDVVQALCLLARRVPTAWRVDAVAASATVARLRDAGVACLDAPRTLDQLSLLVGAGAVVTDDGAIQDATSALGVACRTLGSCTDRPHTVAAGTNALLGDDATALAAIAPTGRAPLANDLPPWDGRAAQRAARVLVDHYVLIAEPEELARP